MKLTSFSPWVTILGFVACACAVYRREDSDGILKRVEVRLPSPSPIQLTSCSEFEFECDNGQCIRSNFRCDLESDCTDESDEAGCEDVSCTDDQFRCTTGQCIPKAFVCDEESDCDDLADEKNCTYSRYYTRNMTTPRPAKPLYGRCEDWQFQCTSGSCIRGSYQCDDDKDCTDGSDEIGCEPCVSTAKLEVDKPPFCKVRIYQGSSRIRNETHCIADDIFLVKSGRLVPHDRRSFTEARVNYVRMNCESYHPVNFEFDGVGHIEQIRVHRTQKLLTDGSGHVVHSTDVTTVATPQATGKYIFTEFQANSTENPKKTSLFFYFEKERKPFLIGAERIQKAKRKPGEDFLTLPCVAARLNITLFLFKEVNGTWNRVDTSLYKYDNQEGFKLNLTDLDAAWKYKCTTDSSLTSDLDSVTVTIDENLIHPPTTPEESNLKIVLGRGLSATCHSVGPLKGSKLEFTNVFADNPLDAKILADCVLKGSHSCGSYSHVRNHQPISDDLRCRHDAQKTQCRHISEIYSQGVLVCQSETESIVQEYFTGLDDIVYKDWRMAPRSSLIRLETLTNVTTGISGNSLSTKCVGISMVFGRNAITFESKSAGTDVVSKHTSGGYHTWSYTLRENMTQLLCSDNIWQTNDRIWSDPVNITVTQRVVVCGVLELKCASGQCVRSSYRCDGDRDCLDGTDELNCPSTTTTTTTEGPIVCTSLQYTCHKYTRSFNETSEPCIPAAYRCDGDSDCGQGEDEENCPSTTTTTSTTEAPVECPNMFRCNNGDCIRSSYKCDMAKDCKDGSDESPIADCPNSPTLAPTSTSSSAPVEAAQEASTALPDDIKSDVWFDWKETPAQPESSSSAAGIIIGVLLSLVLVCLLGVFVYVRYYRRHPGTTTSTNIKYTNPTCDQEEVLIN